MTIELTLSGRPITKKNSMQKTKNGLIQSKAYRKYESDCIWQIPGPVRLRMDKRCNVRCLYYMTIDYNKPDCKVQIDLCNLLSATCDILVKAGVLADDNCRIVAAHDGSRVLYDKARPRVEIRIEVME